VVDKSSIMQKIHDNLLIGVVKSSSLEDNLAYAKAYIDGGIKVLEISTATIEPMETIRQLKQQYKDDVIIGAGTVLDDVTARLMMFAGADFMAAPTFSEEVAKMCNRYQVLYMPTCFTSNEIAVALEHNITTIKLFPGEIYPANVAGVLQKMYTGVNLIAAGGVDINNIDQWLKANIWAIGLVLPFNDLSEVSKQQKLI